MKAEHDLKEILKRNKEELFSEIIEEIQDDYITDVEWDGYNLWITHLQRGSYLSEKKLSEKYVDNLSIRLANLMKTSFNRLYPILEANTEDLRISIWHESRCKRKSIAIRKIPVSLRFDHQSLVNDQYAPESVLHLIENCTRAHFNCIIGGQPHAGKTELLKYLSVLIPPNEKVGVYEDNQEIHYRTINPRKRCAEFFIDDKFSYSDIIKAGLRHNIDWILLSESRGPEVLDLLNSLSTGAYCMTTMHLDNVRDIPDRIYNMLGECNVADHFMNSIYKYIDIGILVECDKNEKRCITQVGFFTREENKNQCTLIYDHGEFTGEKVPGTVLDKMNKYAITDPYSPETGG
jgi:pilus assembly protein CpaF